jgi:hypothetical protein
MRGAGQVARIREGRAVYKISVEKPEGNIPLGRHRHRWRIILRWIFRKWDLEV